MSKKVKIKESTTVKQPVTMKEAPKTIMECSKGVNFVVDIRPRGIIVAYPDKYVTREQAIICLEKTVELLKSSDKKAISLCPQEYYDGGDTDTEFWN